MNDLIEMGKKYQTRGGIPARILCVDGPSGRSVVYLRDYRGIPDKVFTIPANGIHFTDGEESDFDLIEVKESVEMWVNVGPSGRIYPHRSEEGAIRGSRHGLTNKPCPSYKIVARRVELEVD